MAPFSALLLIPAISQRLSSCARVVERRSQPISGFWDLSTTASWGTKLGSYLELISWSEFYEWLFELEKFSGLSRNGPLNRETATFSIRWTKEIIFFQCWILSNRRLLFHRHHVRYLEKPLNHVSMSSGNSEFIWVDLCCSVSRQLALIMRVSSLSL